MSNPIDLTEFVTDVEMAVPPLQRAMITRTRTDSQGNAGLMESHGSYLTVDQAKGHAVALGHRYHPGGDFHWKQFSPTTWGLMAGQRYTYILVSWLGDTANGA